MIQNARASEHHRGLLFAIFSAIGWGATGIFVKLLPTLGTWSIVSLRCFVALFASFLFTLFSGQFRQTFHRLNTWYPWGFGALMVIYYLTAVWAYRLTSVTIVALLLNTSPIFVLIFKFIKRQKTHNKEWLGAIIGFVGILIISYPSFANIKSGDESGIIQLVGIVFALLSSLSITIYAIWMGAMSSQSKQLDQNGITFSTYLLGFMLAGLVGVSLENMAIENFGSTSIKLVGLGLLSTVIPSVCYGLAATKISPILLTTIRLFIPIAAAIFAFIFLGDVPSFWTIPGGILILSGMLLVVNAVKKPER